MPKRALVEQRPWLLLGVVAAIAFYFLADNRIGGLYLICIKGTAVGALAVYAWYRAPGFDGKLLAFVLALSAAGDMALELWFEIGGALFAASHVAATALYLRNRQADPSRSQMLIGAALLIAAPAGSYALSGDPMIGVYGIILGAMAATAWTSRFARYRVGAGAVLFMVSDWLIFSRMGPYDLAPLPDLLIWPLYFAGQLMIATGIVQTLRGENPAR